MGKKLVTAISENKVAAVAFMIPFVGLAAAVTIIGVQRYRRRTHQEPSIDQQWQNLQRLVHATRSQC